MRIFIFQAQIYPSPEELWKHIQKTCDNYISSGQTTGDKLFVLWSGELVRLPKNEGGLGLIDPKTRIDSMAVRIAGKLIPENNATKRWFAERAAALPQGVATLFADPSAAKHWPGGSQRWKAAVEAFWESPYAELPEPKTSWEVEQAMVCFNRKVMFKGKSLYGNQQGTEEIGTASFGVLVEEGPGRERVVKSKETLRTELGGIVAARWALMAYAAMLEEWKTMVTASKSAEAVAAAADVVRSFLSLTQEHLYWKVAGVQDSKHVELLSIRCRKDGNLEEWSRSNKAVFDVKRVEQVAVRGGRVLGALGAPLTRLRQSDILDVEGLVGEGEDLKGDEQAAVALLSEPGDKATWSDGFLSIWRQEQ
ncbi:unnamed protein product [Closterium sp. NIES-64]|nr:unnamed protein product [Closterium sp. NIES-64]